MVDGGTLNRKRHFNASIGCEGKTYFWKSCRVENLTTASVLSQLQEIITDLAKEDIFVFCIVADNTSAFQKAAGFVLLRFLLPILPTFGTAVFEKI